jgi:hypothetical protein
VKESPQQIPTPRRGLEGKRRSFRALVGISTLLLCAATTALASPAGAATCPNEALREAQGATTLPGCMALELANPSKKFSQPAFLPSFSREGERLRIKVQAALADTPGYQNYSGDTYVVSRTTGGWMTAPTSPLDPMITAGGARAGGPSTFTPDLSRWTQFGSTQVQRMVGISRLYGGGLDNSFEPLSPLLVPIDRNPDGEQMYIVPFLEVDGSSDDLGVSVFRGKQASFGYFPEDPRSPSGSESGGDRNSYVASLEEAGEPTLELLARDKDDEVRGGRCGAHLGGETVAFNQGAISADGKRIFFTTRPAQPFDEEEAEGPPCDLANPLRIMQRTATPEGPVITEPIPGGPAEAGDDLFQAASADGTKLYLTTPRDLTASDTDPSSEPCGPEVGKSLGCDLYLYDSAKPEGERVTQVSAGEDASPGVGANVLSSVTAISGDGSRAYFVAQGVLTPDQNPEGESAQAGQPNLYLYEADTEGTSFIATLSGADQGGLWGAEGSFFGDAYAAPLYGAGLQDGGDGHLLAFASKSSLTSDDEDGGFRDVFRYDAEAGTLERISKAAEGGSDNGPFDVSVNPAVAKVTEYNFGEATRWVSEDGETIAFATAEPLLPGDEDEALNPYLRQGGRLGASFAKVSEPPAVAPTSEQIAFSTTTALLPQDEDTAQDVYVAREGGGFLFAVPPTRCDPLQEGSCQSGARAPQVPGAPATLAFSGPGNAKEPPRCRKGRVKRRGRCVKRSRKGKARRAAHKQGGRR